MPSANRFWDKIYFPSANRARNTNWTFLKLSGWWFGRWWESKRLSDWLCTLNWTQFELMDNVHSDSFERILCDAFRLHRFRFPIPVTSVRFTVCWMGAAKLCATITKCVRLSVGIQDAKCRLELTLTRNWKVHVNIFDARKSCVWCLFGKFTVTASGKVRV